MEQSPWVFAATCAVDDEQAKVIAAKPLAGAILGQQNSKAWAALERRVKLVAVELRDPLVWVSASTTTLHDLRQRGI